MENNRAMAASDAASPMDKISSTPSLAALTAGAMSATRPLEAPAAPSEGSTLRGRTSELHPIDIVPGYSLGAAYTMDHIQGGTPIPDESSGRRRDTYFQHRESSVLRGPTPPQSISTRPTAISSPSSLSPSPSPSLRSLSSRVAGLVTRHDSDPPYPMPFPGGTNNHGQASPCFVHSLLDHGASYSSWLEQSPRPRSPDSGQGSSINGDNVGNGGVPQRTPHPQGMQGKRLQYPPDTNANDLGLAKALDIQDDATRTRIRAAQLEFDSSDEDDGHSITKQLAETAVGVRELSKQLGRARVQTNIQSVLIITKARDNRLIKLTRELAIYLMQKKPGGDRGLTVYVDQQLRTSKRFDAEGIERDFPEFFLPSPRRRSSSSNSLPSLSSLSSLSSPPSNPDITASSPYVKTGISEEGQLRYWTSEMCSRNPHLFDFVVTLGGDGTVLFTSWLFQRIVPPVLPFALGSLGFLTNFDFADYAGVMDSAIENGIRVNLRMRFTCTVYRAVAPEPGRGSKAVKKVDTGEILMKNLEKGGWEALEGGSVAATTNPHTLANAKSKDKEIMCFTTRPVESFEVLNDLVVDRGPSPYVSLLELFGDEHHMTTVQADGLTVSTPTGSTAYSLSAGGSLVHPEIPALLITPICPHTLSFRPMLLPDTMELRICVPYNSRSTAWASFDGRGRVELKQGDHIKVTASKYPFPTVCADKQSTDWFHAISRTLKWNERERQKSFVVVEEGPAKQRKVSAVSSPEQHSIGGVPVDVNPADLNENELAVEEPGEEEEDKDQEEEDKFDIDVSSPVASAAKELDSSDQPSPSQDTRNPSLDVLPGVPHPPLSEITGSGTATPDRFHVAHPHPPRIHPRHLISTAAEKIQNLQDHPRRGLSRVDSTIASPSSAEPPVPTITPWHRSDERDGDRDNIRAPESLFQSSKSKIPRDRDIEAESMRTPRTEPIQPLDQDGFPFLPNATHQTHADSTLTSSSHANAPHGRIHPHTLHSHPLRPATATSAAPVHPTLAPVNGYGHRHGQGGLITIPRHHVASTSTPTVPGPAHPHPHIRNHRRHASVDSIGGPRRAFAAWGLDESDSNASDSDA